MLLTPLLLNVSFDLVLDGVVFHLVVVFRVPDLPEGLAEPDFFNAAGLAALTAPVVVVVALKPGILIVQVHLGATFFTDHRCLGHTVFLSPSNRRGWAISACLSVYIIRHCRIFV